MINLWHVLAALLGIGFYIYMIWIAGEEADRSCEKLRSPLLLVSFIAAGSSLFDVLWGLSKGYTLVQIVGLDVSEGRFMNAVCASITMIATSLCLAVHYVISFHRHSRAKPSK